MLNLLALDVANVAKTVLGIGGLIFFHELGHFLVGRACGVKAEAFSIGFGPVLAKWQPGETEYRLSAVPLGGYVKFLGENPDERGDVNPRSFHAATYPRKAAIMLAGVTMNVIAAFILFVAAFSRGVDLPAPVIGSLTPGMPAEAAGLKPGDRFLRIDGHRILDFSDVAQECAFTEEVEVVVERAGAELPPIRIRTALSKDDGIRRIGFSQALDSSGLMFPTVGSQAESAGLRAGDRAVAVNGAAVADLEAAWSLHRAAAATGAASVAWTVVRDDARVEVPLPTSLWRIGIAHDAAAPVGEWLTVTIDPTLPSAARDAGIPTGARLVSADGAPVRTLDDLKKAVAIAGPAAREVAIEWRAPEGSAAPTTTQVRPAKFTAETLGDLGVAMPGLRHNVREENVLRAAGLGLDRTHRWVMRILSTLRSLVTGGVSAKQLQGPIALAKSTYETADMGWPYLFLFLGMISMNLAVLNVLPVPLLDGGQLALITIEKVRGRPLPDRVLEVVQWTGLVLLLSFMLFVVVNDLRR
ncbi:MAG: site-2 protease family protein [Planctomycetes bacterium]|nr:site-2 protease family protein [Planctomycetota bacterium]